MEKVLVTGGAGFIGSELIPALLKREYEVICYDSLMYGCTPILPNFYNPKFRFVKGDVRDYDKLLPYVKEASIIIHLAAIVGYPACKKDPILAKLINEDASKWLADNVKPEQKILYASTGSNYGAVVGEICTEETELKPLTVYGKTKTAAETYFLNNKSNNTVVLRFATGFGISPRLRLDLLINDFAYQVVKNNYLLLYEKTFKRTFIHVKDMVRAFLFAIDSFDKMKNQAYNVGSNDLNFSKYDIALLLKKHRDYYLHSVEVGKDAVQRNYEVSYKKINDLGFSTVIGIEEGIRELMAAMEAIEVKNPHANV